MRFAAGMLPLLALPCLLPAADPPPLTGIKFRSIGPATFSGRVVSFAVHPEKRSTYYVGVASGGVWKTTTAGTSWTPVFENEGSFSIGTVVLDPRNPETVWVGTGEANSQRSVSWGDGVYKSEDGGKSWRNVGLKTSEHIGRIAIDPTDSNIVYAAAQGPLWSPGGDRGLFKTTDGGKTWKNILNVSENTGVTEIVIDRRDPKVLLAASWQRRRHVWTMINGGPESAIHKSTDGGETWKKISAGLPTEELGRASFAVPPTAPNIIYATIEAANGKSAIFRSADFGSTWEKRSDYAFASMYFGRIFADPVNAERIYIMDVPMYVSNDGGATKTVFGAKNKHVDNHVLWIDPKDPDYYLAGCDGGIYESFNRGAQWRMLNNLSITQFYDVAVDNQAPFYNVYGGTQDNFSMGGPARTRSASGATNADWFVTNGGDGFQSRVDPADPNIVYAESQYGGLVRFDRRTGERVSIQPRAKIGEAPPRWNWDSPVLASTHKPGRIYFAANKVYKSEDRGDSWEPASPDLTRQVDRDALPVMGKVWGPDAVAKHASTSFYSNITALTESPKTAGLLYAGTDDGLIQVTDNGGKDWRKIEKFPGVPDNTYVARVLPSQHEARSVYAAFDNHKNGDYKPYLLKSTDAGRTWQSAAGDLPEKGPVLAIAEDHIDPSLLFAGTEYGFFFSLDGGVKWNRLKNGLPVIPVRDIAIQKQMNDIVIATFGRGFYVLDDYSALRKLAALGDKDSLLVPPSKSYLYVPTRPYGNTGKAWQGEAFFTSDNPPFGSTFAYYVKDALRTRAERRREAEKKGDAPRPSKDDLRVEAQEEAPAMFVAISDPAGRVIRRVKAGTAKGFQRVTWDLREAAYILDAPRRPGAADGPGDGDEENEPSGLLVMPGTYKAQLLKRVDGVTSAMGDAVTFEVSLQSGPAKPRPTVVSFQQKVVRLHRAAHAALQAATAAKTALGQMKTAIDQTPGSNDAMASDARRIDRTLEALLMDLRGDTALRARSENTPDALIERIGGVASAIRFITVDPPKTYADEYADVAAAFDGLSAKLKALLETDMRKLMSDMNAAGSPWTPGRLPDWKRE